MQTRLVKIILDIQTATGTYNLAGNIAAHIAG